MSQETNNIASSSKYRMRGKSKYEQLVEKPAVFYDQGEDEDEYKLLLKDLQSNILKHNFRAHAEYHFLTFKDQESAWTFLTHLSNFVTSAYDQLEAIYNPRVKNDQPVLNIYISREGFQVLGTPENLVPDDDAFQKGMDGRVQLGKKENAPIHAFVLFAWGNAKGDEINDMSGAGSFSESKLSLFLSENGIGELTQHLNLKESSLEIAQFTNPLKEEYHFKDGHGNPRFFTGNSEVAHRKYANPARLDLVLTKDKAGGHPYSYGSYAVYLKLGLDETAIDKLVRKMNIEGGNRNLAIARIIGRFRDGTPLTLSKRAINRLNKINDFDYQERFFDDGDPNDQSGSRCPYFSHIRKSNPRMEEMNSSSHPDYTPSKYLGKGDKSIVRRGMFYNNSKEDEKGLLFLSFQNSIEDQFEYILNYWIMNDYSTVDYRVKNSDAGGSAGYNTNIPVYNKTGKDILFSQAGEAYTFFREYGNSASEPETIKVPEPIVQFKGGLYLFAPSLSFLQLLTSDDESDIREVEEDSKINKEEPAGRNINISISPTKKKRRKLDQSKLKSYKNVFQVKSKKKPKI